MSELYVMNCKMENFKCPDCNNHTYKLNPQPQQFRSTFECSSCGYIRGGFSDTDTLIKVVMDEIEKEKLADKLKLDIFREEISNKYMDWLSENNQVEYGLVDVFRIVDGEMVKEKANGCTMKTTPETFEKFCSEMNIDIDCFKNGKVLFEYKG